MDILKNFSESIVSSYVVTPVTLTFLDKTKAPHMVSKAVVAAATSTFTKCDLHEAVAAGTASAIVSLLISPHENVIQESSSFKLFKKKEAKMQSLQEQTVEAAWSGALEGALTSAISDTMMRRSVNPKDLLLNAAIGAATNSALVVFDEKVAKPVKKATMALNVVNKFIS